MVIQCTLSVSLKNIGTYAGKLSEVPPLPGYITRRGPFIQDGAAGGDDRIITIYEFDKSRLADAWQIISNQLDAFHDIPGFIVAAHRSIVFTEKNEKKAVRPANRRLVRITKEEI
jgi:hypothetical protein